MEREALEELVYQIEGMVGTVAADPAIADADLRRVLSFVAKMALVVDQAFQDVLAVLIDLKYMTEGDLASGEVRNLRKQLELVTSRSRYRDAEDWHALLGRPAYRVAVANSSALGDAAGCRAGASVVFHNGHGPPGATPDVT